MTKAQHFALKTNIKAAPAMKVAKERKPPVATEKTIHGQVVKWFKLQYKGYILHTDFAAGTKMTIGQAKQNAALQSGRGWPDIFICHPNKKGNAGLFIEVKRDIAQVYKKDMTYKKDEHIEEQAAMLEKLQGLNYAAFFGCGFQHCIDIINSHLKS